MLLWPFCILNKAVVLLRNVRLCVRLKEKRKCFMLQSEKGYSNNISGNNILCWYHKRFESLFITGCFPDELEIANVILLYKADDRMCLKDYRIFLLCIMSKVFERVIYNRLISLLEINTIIIENQFGFRNKCSTYVALAVLIDKVIKSLENGDYVIVFFLFLKGF